jgi:anti-sigma factor RsiW
MRNEHIHDILDRAPVSALDATERDRVESHVAACEECRLAYDAARVAAGLLAARAAAEIAPPPFFHTRVMAAIRERRESQDVNVFAWLWRSAGPMFAAMTAVVLLLVTLTVFAGRVSAPEGSPEIAVADPIGAPDWASADAPDGGRDDISDDQIYAMMYTSEEDYGDGR